MDTRHRSRLRWRCRRGMRELDVLLERFLDRQYDRAGEGARQAFEQLLELPDPEILALLTGRSLPDGADQAYVVERLSAHD